MSLYSASFNLTPAIQPVTFNPHPRIHTVQLMDGQSVYVVDDFVQNPGALVALGKALAHQFVRPKRHPYPGPQLSMSPDYSAKLEDFFQRHIRARLHGKDSLGMSARFARVTQDSATLDARQRICHRDNSNVDPNHTIAAMVHYLFHDEQLGGTVFFRPVMSAEVAKEFLADSISMDGDTFGEKYQMPSAYMTHSNAYFEVIGRIPAKWNRAIFYDGAIFHSGDIQYSPSLKDQDGLGRLTVNGFFASTRLSQ